MYFSEIYSKISNLVKISLNVGFLYPELCNFTASRKSFMSQNENEPEMF